MKSQWAELLQETLGERAEAVPEGWHRVSEVAAAWARSNSQTRKLLSDLIASGKAECKEFRVPQLNGAVKAIPHFRISNDKRTRATPRAYKSRSSKAD